MIWEEKDLNRKLEKEDLAKQRLAEESGLQTGRGCQRVPARKTIASISERQTI
jgi:hypothetical protein